MQCTINLPVKIPFTSVGLATGLTSFSPHFLLNGSTLVVTPITYSEIGNGLYTINFTPVVSGLLSIFIEQTLIRDIEIVNRTNTAILQNLEDDTLGSWTWDKALGTLNVIRQDGTPLANFKVIETTSNASRERI
jgi:hypothetical protein